MDEGEITEPEEYTQDKAHTVIALYIKPVIFIVGILGNILSIFVFKRRNIRSSTSIYLLMIAIGSLVYLIVYTPYVTQGFINNASDAYVTAMGFYQCYFAHYVIGAIHFTVTWLTVMVSIERCALIRYPGKFKIFHQHGTAVKITGVICFVSAIAHIQNFFECRPNYFDVDDWNSTDYHSEDVILLNVINKKVSITVMLLISEVIPYVVLIFCCVSLVYYVIVYAQKKDNHVGPSSDEEANQHTRSVDARDAYAVTAMVLANTILFLISDILSTFLNVKTLILGYKFFEKITTESIGFYSNTMSMLYFCFSSIVYLAISTIYRQQVKSLLRIGSPPSVQTAVSDIEQDIKIETEMKKMSE